MLRPEPMVAVVTALASPLLPYAGAAPRAEPVSQADVRLGGPPKDGLCATLVPLKTEYAPHERLDLVFYVQNVTDPVKQKVIVLDGCMIYLGHIWIEVRDADGQEVPHRDTYIRLAIAGPQGPEDFVHLRPGRVLGHEFTKHAGRWWGVAIAEPGTYTVGAIFRVSSRGRRWGLRAWTGKLVSNWVTVTVREE